MPRRQSELNFREIEDRAAAIAEQHRFDPERDDVRCLATNMRGSISVVDGFDPSFVDGGSLVVRHGPVFNIYLSRYTGQLRDNFTIAHEIGHFILHVDGPDEGEVISFTRYGDDIYERQANRFAAALLMPRHRFLAIAEAVNNDVAVLAGRFRVSPRAAEVRLQSLSR